MEHTIKKELFEETWIKKCWDIINLEDFFFDVNFYSPYRNKNYKNKTHIFMTSTEEEINKNLLSENEKSIQTPIWLTIDEIKKIMLEWKDTINYESMEYVIEKLKN